MLFLAKVNFNPPVYTATVAIWIALWDWWATCSFSRHNPIPRNPAMYQRAQKRAQALTKMTIEMSNGCSRNSGDRWRQQPALAHILKFYEKHTHNKIDINSKYSRGLVHFFVIIENLIFFTINFVLHIFHCFFLYSRYIKKKKSNKSARIQFLIIQNSNYNFTTQNIKTQNIYIDKICLFTSAVNILFYSNYSPRYNEKIKSIILVQKGNILDFISKISYLSNSFREKWQIHCLGFFFFSLYINKNFLNYLKKNCRRSNTRYLYHEKLRKIIHNMRHESWQ